MIWENIYSWILSKEEVLIRNDKPSQKWWWISLSLWWDCRKNEYAVGESLLSIFMTSQESITFYLVVLCDPFLFPTTLLTVLVRYIVPKSSHISSKKSWSDRLFKNENYKSNSCHTVADYRPSTVILKEVLLLKVNTFKL